MKVLHLCSADSLSGAGNAAKMTHETMLDMGIDSKILYLVKNKNFSKFEYSYVGHSLLKKILRKVITFLDNFCLYFYLKREHRLFSPGLFGLNLRNNEFVKWADIIHIHWVNHGFVNISEISKWDKKIIWTLRDMWAFTGGCHQSFECLKYQSICNSCFQLGSSKDLDLSYLAFNYKLKFLKHANIKWVAISSWMKNVAINSNILLGKEIDIVYSGIRTNDFVIKDKNYCRLSLGLPLNKKIILIGASNFKETYKGYKFTTDCLNSIDIDILVISFGSDYILDTEIKQNFTNFGFIDNISTLCLLYNSADIFLSPSIAEAFGKTFAEAQSCGLPVICFDRTGPADIVVHKKTGYVADYKNLDDLIYGVNFCLSNKFDSLSIRNRAIELFDIKSAAVEYLKIYSQIYD